MFPAGRRLLSRHLRVDRVHSAERSRFRVLVLLCGFASFGSKRGLEQQAKVTKKKVENVCLPGVDLASSSRGSSCRSAELSEDIDEWGWPGISPPVQDELSRARLFRKIGDFESDSEVRWSAVGVLPKSFPRNRSQG